MTRKPHPRAKGDKSTAEHVGPVVSSAAVEMKDRWHVCAACVRSWRGKRNLPRCAPRKVTDGWPG